MSQGAMIPNTGGAPIGREPLPQNTKTLDDRCITPNPPKDEVVEALQIRSRELPGYAQGLCPGTLLQLVMLVEFLSSGARITLLEMALAALQPLTVDRHDRGRIANRLERNRRSLAALSNDRFLRLGSNLMTVAERFAGSVIATSMRRWKT
jgi:hypothetical protein